MSISTLRCLAAAWILATILVNVGVGANPPLSLRPISVLQPDTLSSESEAFGRAIAISGDKILVGAPLAGPDVGVANLHDFSTGQRLATFAPPDGQKDGHFGWAVALDDSLAAIGRPGADQVALYDPRTGAAIDVLNGRTGRARETYFGDSLALDSTRLLIGAPFDTTPQGKLRGSVSVWDRAAQTITAKWSATSYAPIAGQFGYSVALDGALAVVGAPGTGVEAAYLFDVASGTEIHKLTLPTETPSPFSQFGWSVATAGGIAAVGDPGRTAISSTGAVFLYNADGALLRTLVAEPDSGDRGFGVRISASGNLLLVAASASSYLFDLPSGRQLLRFEANDLSPHAVGTTGDRLTGIQTLGSGGRIAATFNGAPSSLYPAWTVRTAQIVPEPTAHSIALTAVTALAFWRRRDLKM